MKPKICVSLSSKNPNELYRKARRAEALSADLVEVRLDELSEYQGISKVAKSVGIPVVATNRRVSQEGSFAHSESERLGLLMDAIEGGAAYVDIESSTSHLDHPITSRSFSNSKVIRAEIDTGQTAEKQVRPLQDCHHCSIVRGQPNNLQSAKDEPWNQPASLLCDGKTRGLVKNTSTILRCRVHLRFTEKRTGNCARTA